MAFNSDSTSRKTPQVKSLGLQEDLEDIEQEDEIMISPAFNKQNLSRSLLDPQKGLTKQESIPSIPEPSLDTQPMNEERNILADALQENDNEHQIEVVEVNDITLNVAEKRESVEIRLTEEQILNLRSVTEESQKAKEKKHQRKVELRGRLLEIKKERLREGLMGYGSEMEIVKEEEEEEDYIPHAPSKEETIPQWDYVICVENPDKDVSDTKGITKEDAKEIFENCFKMEQLSGLLLTSDITESENDVYMDCFEQLNNKDQDEKLYNNGHRFRKEPQEGTNKEIWIDSGGRPRDFQSLILNLILYKLVYILELETKLVFSNNGETIYILVRADTEKKAVDTDGNKLPTVIEKWADALSFNAQLHIGRTDLSSQEPCTHLLLRYRNLNKSSPFELTKAAGHPQLNLEQHELELKKLFHVIDKQKGQSTTTDLYKIEHNKDKNYAMWRFYSVYLEYLIKGWPLRKKADKRYRAVLVNKLVEYSKTKANEVVITENKGFAKYKLKSLWDRLGIAGALGPYIDYKIEHDQRLFLHHKGQTPSSRRTVFHQMQKLKILDCIIQSQLVIPVMFRSELISGYFPLHNEPLLKGTTDKIEQGLKLPRDIMMDQLKEVILESSAKKKESGLVNRWKFNWRKSTYVPGNDIRKYFGEKLGMYFEWISHYAKYCLGFSFFGILFYILLQIIRNDAEVPAEPEQPYLITGSVFTFILIIWSTLFQEHWKRKQIMFSIKWGMLDFEDDETIRTEFKGITRCSPVTGQYNDIYYSPIKRLCKTIIGASFSITLIAISIFLVVLFSDLKDKYNEEYEGEPLGAWIPTIFSTANAIQILLFNIIHGIMAIKFTNFENHRTQTEHESSLITKTFLFQFFNSYYSLFYLAFMKEKCIGEGENGELSLDSNNSCIFELETQLMMICITGIIKNILEIGIPYMKGRYRMKMNKAEQLGNKGIEISPVEKLRSKVGREYMLEDYSKGGLDGTYGEYLEMVIQYGYIILFGFSFPLAVTLAAVNNVIEILVDKYKLITLVKRPVPLGASSIGIWQMILNSLSYIGILCNVGILTFTLGVIEDQKYITFIFLCFSLILVKYIISLIVPDIPTAFQNIRKRHEIVIEKAFQREVTKATKIDEIIDIEQAKKVSKFKAD